jgi:signal transduction histidine kinase/iron only hydrogenase large subunit-like protein
MQPRSLVQTIQERCRVCYTCVRECPAKAIRVATGQAEVIPERCIGCGNCIRVCSQSAKRVESAIAEVQQLLSSPRRVAAVLAPSFPAEFADLDYHRVVGMLRSLGFNLVTEVSFGADLVARAYQKLLAETPDKRYIATTCPALVSYVERYQPDLVTSLAPIISPMIAAARAIHRLHGDDVRVVFIGPCIAKKGEADSPPVAGQVSAALTFTELREMLRARWITPDSVTPSDFDPPHGGLGGLFAISRGMLQAASINEDLITGDVVAAEGRGRFIEALEGFASGELDARLLEVLCCNGCIMGAGMSAETALFRRRSRVSHYVRQRQASIDRAEWQKNIDRCADLDLRRRFVPNDQRMPVPLDDVDISDILARMGKFSPQDELNCGACGYETCREHAVAIFKGLAENEMCLPYTIEELKKTVKNLAVTNDQLASAQAALIQSEKLASMGQLAAGIAHEVNNPLGVVLMHSHLLLEEHGGEPRLREDLSTIVDQADRCKKIVAGLLHFARQNKVVLEPTDLRQLAERTMKAMHLPDNVVAHVECRLEDPLAEVDRDQLVQVLTNLVSNAQAAMPAGGTLTISLDGDADHVRLAVADTGVGIPKENLDKIFEPFFTTKQIGKGTGLGLAVTYGIIKMHHGDVAVTSNADPAAGPTGTTFTITLPRKGQGG